MTATYSNVKVFVEQACHRFIEHVSCWPHVDPDVQLTPLLHDRVVWMLSWCPRCALPVRPAPGACISQSNFRPGPHEDSGIGKQQPILLVQNGPVSKGSASHAGALHASAVKQQDSSQLAQRRR